jgi:hypothetical protein
MTQVVECLLCKRKVLSSNPFPQKKKRVHMVLQGKEEGPQEGVGTREMKRTCSVSFPLQDQIPEIDN